VATFVKAVRPEIRVIGVQTTDSDAMARSLQAGRRVQLQDVGLFSDGTAVRLVGEETFRLCRQHVDEIITVDTDALCAAIKDVFQDTRACWSRPARWRWPAARRTWIASAYPAARWWRSQRRQPELRPPALRGRGGPRSAIR